MISENIFDGLPEVMTVERVADFLGVCERTVRREIAAGRLSRIRVGRSVRITREQLEQYVNGNGGAYARG